MSQLYTLVPRPVGLFEGIDPVSRMVFGVIWDRYRLSCYNAATDPDAWYDENEAQYFCVFNQQELAEIVGVSERTVRRSLEALRDSGLMWWRKATYKGANRYFFRAEILEYFRAKNQ